MLFGLVGRREPGAKALARHGSAGERRQIALRHGYNGMSFLTLYPGWEYFHPAEGDGFVAFERHRGVALACGDPVCPPGEEARLLEAFRAWAASEGLTPAFAGASERLATAAAELGWKALKVGEEPIFDVAGYAPRGNKTKKVRSAANQARKNGVTVECLAGPDAVPPTLALEILDTQAAWQASRKVKALSFTLRLAPLDHLGDKLLIVARHGGRIEGFLTCIPVPARNAYAIEDIIRRPDAANGVSELLFLHAIELLRERGVAAANLGLAPLRNTKRQPHGHRLMGRALDFAFGHVNAFYGFKSLEHFKAKFAPDAWESAYVVYRPGRLVRVAMALGSAFAPGTLGPVSTVASRIRPRRAEGARLSLGNLAGVAGAGVVAALYGVLAWQNPELAEPIRGTAQALASPVVHAEQAARAHLVVDALLLLGAGGWFARSAGRD